MTTMPTLESLTEKVQQLHVLRAKYIAAMGDYDSKALKEKELEQRVTKLWWEEILEGNVQGKNEREREAEFYRLHKDLMDESMRAQYESMVTKGNLYRARTEYESAKDIFDTELMVMSDPNGPEREAVAAFVKTIESLR